MVMNSCTAAANRTRTRTISRRYWLAAALGSGIIAQLRAVGMSAATDVNTPVLRHTGMANASAGAFVDDTHFVAASDEDNRLRLYRSDREGAAVAEFDMSRFLEVSSHSPEVDIEGAARLGDRVYWLGSHSRSRDGRWRQNRHRFFATTIGKEVSTGFPKLTGVGIPCSTLLEQLLKEPKCADIGLAGAARSEVKELSFNLEGLAGAPNEGLLLGFRSPLIKEQAVLVPLLNPSN